MERALDREESDNGRSDASSLYERDLHEWSQDRAARLRDSRLTDLDWD